MFMHFVFIQTSLQSALAYFLIHHDHRGALFDTDIREITFNRKTLLTGTGCQSSFHLSEMCVCVCVCVCVFASVMWPYVIWPLIFSLPFLLLLFFFPLIMPCHTGFLFLSLKQARYISNQPLWTWYNMCIKFTSPRSAYSCLLLIVQFSTQTLPLRKQLPVSLSTLINFILGWRNLVGCHLWGRTELDTTEAT